jgi:transposase
MEATLFVLLTGILWRALPRCYEAATTARDRFQEWTRAGVFEELWKRALLEYDQEVGLWWTWQAVDGAMTKAPLGGEATGPNPTDCAKKGVKRSLQTDGAGIPIGLAIGPANRNDHKLLPATLESRPLLPPGSTSQHMCLDTVLKTRITARSPSGERVSGPGRPGSPLGSFPDRQTGRLNGPTDCGSTTERRVSRPGSGGTVRKRGGDQSAMKQFEIDTDEALARCQQVNGALWVGLDVHRSTCTAAAFDGRGEEVARWKFPTHRGSLLALARALPSRASLALEASTTGKAVFRLLREAGVDVHMADTSAMGRKPQVKTDERDAMRLARRLQLHDLPEAYVPPPDFELIRDLVRFRMALGRQVTEIKQRVHALVERDLLGEQLAEHSDIFSGDGLDTLVGLSFSDRDRGFLRSYLQQLSTIVGQEEWVEGEMARLARERRDVELLMTIPGIDFYSALAIIGEIGEIHRFRDAKKLYSYAGVVPRADNSGERVSEHRSVKRGNRVLKYFLTCAVMGAVKAKRANAVARFYRKKSKVMPGPKALVAATRKLAGVVWAVLRSGMPYEERDPKVIARKQAGLQRKAKISAENVVPGSLRLLVESLKGREGILQRVGSLGAAAEVT